MWVAALGELYSENQGGGVYRTEDGGDTWTRVLTVQGNAKSVVGAVDLVVDQRNPDHLYASTWDRTRRAHEFTEAGAGSGIWESEDGGDTWTRISQLDGFPEGPEAGRIGLAHHAASNTLYALIDNQAARPQDEAAAEEGELIPASFLDMSAEAFLALDNDTLQTYLDENGFQPADSAAAIKARVERAELSPGPCTITSPTGMRRCSTLKLSAQSCTPSKTARGDAPTKVGWTTCGTPTAITSAR